MSAKPVQDNPKTQRVLKKEALHTAFKTSELTGYTIHLTNKLLINILRTGTDLKKKKVHD